MELKRLSHDADELIRKVVSRYNQLYIPAGKISQIELDLLLDDIRNLYDTFKNIGHMSLTLQKSIDQPEVKVNTEVPVDCQPLEPTPHVLSEKQVESVPSVTKAVVSDPEPEPVNDIKTEITSEAEPEITLAEENKTEAAPIPKIEAEPVHDSQVLASTEVQELGNPVHDTEEKSHTVNHDPAPATLADRFNTGNKSLSESLASPQSQAVMGSRILFQPISDLITGIGLNDKFSFISDLFSNNTAQYDEAILRINKAVNLDEANWILQKYHTNEWEHNQETLARLKDFLKRRFI